MLIGRAALVLSTFLYTAAATSDICYGESGNQDPTLQVCDPTAALSSCCKGGDICFSNGLCETPGADGLTTYTIRGCTNKTGDTGECLPWGECITAGVGVKTCNNDEYCCYGLDGCSCTNATEVFTLDAGVVLTTLPATAATTSTATTSSSATSSAAATTTSSTQSSSSAATSSAAPATTSGSSSSTNSTAIGVGVGVAVGVILIAAALGAYLYRRRKRRNAAEAVVAGHYGPTEDKPRASSALGPPTYDYPQELPTGHSQPMSELPAEVTPAEMASGKTATSMHGAPARYM